MSGFCHIRRCTFGAILVAAVAGATTLFGADAATGPGTMPGTIPTAPTTPLDPALAYINGKEVNREAFNAIMVQVAGMRVFQQVFDLTIVQNACNITGVSMDPKDYGERLQKELDKTLESMVINTPPGTPTLTDEEKKKQRGDMLGQVLARQGVTAVEFRIGLETRAGLRALAMGKIPAVEEKDIHAAYLAQYGERRTVHIQVIPDDDTVSAKVASDYKSLITTGKKLKPDDKEVHKFTPEEAAGELKLGQPANWTISANADNIPEIKGAAFDARLTRAGDFSPITTVKGQNGGPSQKVVIMLDSIEADKTGANLETDKLKAELKQKVFDAKEAAWMNERLQILRANATVDIKDPVLKDQFDQVAAGMRAAASQAASAPTGTAPATTPAPAPASTRSALPGIPTSLPK